MTEDRLAKGDGIRLARLLEIPDFHADRFWPDIPLLLVLGDEEGYAKTGVIRVPGQACSTTSLLDLRSEVEHCPISIHALVVPVCSKRVTATQLPITVGRSGANDVCLNHKSISKYHGQFVPPIQVPYWRIRDCGSLNGTWIEGLQVQPDESFRIRAFADIVFGTLHCRFLLPHTLTGLVNLMKETEDAEVGKDTDPDIQLEELDYRRTPTETWGGFRPTAELDQIRKSREEYEPESETSL